jgi:hypothetical protein
LSGVEATSFVSALPIAYASSLGEVPGHEFLDSALRMAIDDLLQGFGDVGDRTDVVQFAGRYGGDQQRVRRRDRFRVNLTQASGL